MQSRCARSALSKEEIKLGEPLGRSHLPELTRVGETKSDSHDQIFEPICSGNSVDGSSENWMSRTKRQMGIATTRRLQKTENLVNTSPNGCHRIEECPEMSESSATRRFPRRSAVPVTSEETRSPGCPWLEKSRLMVGNDAPIK